MAAIILTALTLGTIWLAIETWDPEMELFGLAAGFLFGSSDDE